MPRKNLFANIAYKTYIYQYNKFFVYIVKIEKEDDEHSCQTTWNITSSKTANYVMLHADFANLKSL